MPDVAPFLFSCIPVVLSHTRADGIGSIILIATQHFQHPITFVGNGVEANELMRLRDREEGGANLFPVVHGLVVEISPVEIVISIETSRHARISKVEHLFGIHSHEDLHQGEHPREDALMAIFLYLVGSLHRWHLATLQLYVDERHPVDEEQQVATSIGKDAFSSLKLRLLCDLVVALSACYF